MKGHEPHPKNKPKMSVVILLKKRFFITHGFAPVKPSFGRVKAQFVHFLLTLFYGVFGELVLCVFIKIVKDHCKIQGFGPSGSLCRLKKIKFSVTKN